MKGKSVLLAVCFAMMGLITQSVHAVQVTSQGGLVEALPCTISRGDLIEVEFGESLVIRNLDGMNYSKPVPYQIDCDDIAVARMKYTR